MNYYNEHDPFAAAWLRELIAAGEIPDGHVDERDIQLVQPADLAGFVQCHFFAGIGGWSLALRLARWPAERPVWTASCPCQPLSCAGQRKGHADERHLWPAFHALLDQCQPPTVFGEQVASADGREWLAGIRADLEGGGYAVGAADLCAASAGAPHIRQRLYWVADAGHERTRRAARPGEAEGGRTFGDASGRGAPGWLADGTHDGRGQERANGHRRDERSAEEGRAARPGLRGPPGWLADGEQPGLEGQRRNEHDRLEPGRHGAAAPRPVAESSPTGGLGESNGAGPQPGRAGSAPDGHRRAALPTSGAGGMAFSNEGERGRLADGEGRHRYGPARGRQQGDGELEPSGLHFWSAYDLLPCRDGKARRVEPGTFPLAHGVPARVGRLRGYGNAIVPQIAAHFIQAAEEALNPHHHGLA